MVKEKFKVKVVPNWEEPWEIVKCYICCTSI
jgi:hypothetical protein